MRSVFQTHCSTDCNFIYFQTSSVDYLTGSQITMSKHPQFHSGDRRGANLLRNLAELQSQESKSKKLREYANTFDSLRYWSYSPCLVKSLACLENFLIGSFEKFWTARSSSAPLLCTMMDVHRKLSTHAHLKVYHACAKNFCTHAQLQTGFSYEPKFDVDVVVFVFLAAPAADEWNNFTIDSEMNVGAELY